MPGKPISTSASCGRSEIARSTPLSPSAGLEKIVARVLEDHPQRLTRVCIVLDQENPLSGGRAHGGAGRGTATAAGPGRARQAHGEDAAEAFAVAARLDRPAVHLDDAPHDRKTDAEPAARPVAALDALLKEIEHARQHVRCNADAGILYAQNGVTAFGERANSDLPGRRELDRVADQVRDHLLEPFGIAVDPYGVQLKVERRTLAAVEIHAASEPWSRRGSRDRAGAARA